MKVLNPNHIMIFLPLLQFRLLLVPFSFFSALLLYLWGSSSPTPSFTYPSLSITRLSDLMNTVPDRRLRISKLEKTTRLGPTSMWVAFPSEEKIIPGTLWYQTVWDKHDLDGVRFIDDMIAVSPCQSNPNQIFIQIGAHLGIFPLFAAYRGCRAIAVEAMPPASNFSRISALLNGWDERRFLGINAAGSHKDGHIIFDTTKISISTDKEGDANRPGLVRVPMLTMDTIDKRYGRNRITGKSDITFVVIDVEGHEQDVLLGAKELIEGRSVLIFEIEVWTAFKDKGTVRNFPGLELLVANGYKLHAAHNNAELNYKSCDDLSTRMSDIPRLYEKTCQAEPAFAGNCLFEMLAVRSDVLPIKQWSSQCLHEDK